MAYFKSAAALRVIKEGKIFTTLNFGLELTPFLKKSLLNGPFPIIVDYILYAILLFHHLSYNTLLLRYATIYKQKVPVSDKWYMGTASSWKIGKLRQ